jgi:hypothetical protein
MGSGWSVVLARNMAGFVSPHSLESRWNRSYRSFKIALDIICRYIESPYEMFAATVDADKCATADSAFEALVVAPSALR